MYKKHSFILAPTNVSGIVMAGKLVSHKKEKYLTCIVSETVHDMKQRAQLQRGTLIQ